jgi:hypothetical protein
MKLTDIIKENWLFEMPERTGKGVDNFPILLTALKENIEAGFEITKLTVNINQLIANDIIFVWEEINNNPEIIIELNKFQSGYAVLDVGKLQGSPIRAESFYSDLLKIYKVLIFSGELLSDQGAGIWKKLIDNGHTVQAYDTTTANHFRITNSDELDDEKFNNRDVRFVLSENKKESMKLWNHFEILKIQSLTHNMTPIEILNKG